MHTGSWATNFPPTHTKPTVTELKHSTVGGRSARFLQERVKFIHHQIEINIMTVPSINTGPNIPTHHFITLCSAGAVG
jgi:hypothetical protein